ncbi:GSU2403 family nucleotidyltransferase fold protein [Asticcacaulis solisilvae]|uniref:GSU2403 family nucleotidyltransferase fold protein n=1 Tax=Asticcacaulis solisilvae TaxID=1217274 RepID=UPI003FD6EF92
MANVGVFRLGGTIVGTHAFRFFEGELGLRYRFDDTAQTDDLRQAYRDAVSQGPRWRERLAKALEFYPQYVDALR